MGTRVCLVTPNHLSIQPRALRDADTLQEAGYRVRVVYRQLKADLVERDTRAMRYRSWSAQAVDLRRDWPTRSAWLLESLRARAAQRLYGAGLRRTITTVHALTKGFGSLAAAASAEPADWYIGHTQTALPAAAAAARHWGAHLGFDCWDLLSQTGEASSDLVDRIERTFLPRCDYVTVPSESIARWLARTHRIAEPVVLYNTFPLSLASDMLAPDKRAPSGLLRLHWFSLTIGHGRGIEDALEALALLGPETHLHLRGDVAPAFRPTLHAMIQRLGLAARVHVHPPVDHDRLIRCMGEFDVGLALERPDHGNYARTVTNKVFAYLLAGLALVVTDTPGQREVLQQAPRAGFLYPAGNAAALAYGLRHWAEDPASLLAAKTAAWRAARDHLCWDHEKDKLLNQLARP
jgi:glycosyltransferase involved in cell wall biosynthesis